MRDRTTQRRVWKKIEEGTKALRQESSLTRIEGNFLGDQPIDLPYAATLSKIFFERIFLHFQGPSYGTVTQAARNIILATGLAVNVTPDVESTGSAGAGGAPPVAGGGQSPQMPPVAQALSNPLSLITGALPRLHSAQISSQSRLHPQITYHFPVPLPQARRLRPSAHTPDG